MRDHRHPEIAARGQVQLGHGAVRAQVRVLGARGPVLHPAPGGVGPCLEARQHALLEGLQAGDGARPHVPLGDRVVGDDVGLVAGLREHPVHALVGLDVLPEGGHRVVAEHGGVQRVAPQVREGGGVSRLAEVLDLPRGDGDDVHLEKVLVGRMHHQGGVHTVEGARLPHVDLAAAPLLGRRAEHHEPAPYFVGQRGRRQTGT